MRHQIIIPHQWVPVITKSGQLIFKPVIGKKRLTMKIKNLIRLTEQQPISVQLFYKLATEHNIDFKKVYKFLIRLEKLRRTFK